MVFRLVIAIVLIAGVIYGIGSYLSPDDLANCTKPEATGPCRKAGAIVVVSGGDTTARTKQAIQLFKGGWASYIVFSGAAADKEGPSNAAVMQQQALDSGVPKWVTIIEDQSETTRQNAEQVKHRLEVLSVNDIILVTSGYHLRRASLEFSSQFGNDVSVRRHPSVGDKHWGAMWWLTPWGWWLALGELVKIGIFYVGGTR